jgi:hypothetical protein
VPICPHPPARSRKGRPLAPRHLRGVSLQKHHARHLYLVYVQRAGLRVFGGRFRDYGAAVRARDALVAALANRAARLATVTPRPAD